MRRKRATRPLMKSVQMRERQARAPTPLTEETMLHRARLGRLSRLRPTLVIMRVTFLGLSSLQNKERKLGLRHGTGHPEVRVQVNQLQRLAQQWPTLTLT